MEFKISALAIQYLKEALCNIYWYKNDLKSFLLNCIDNKPVVVNTNWNNYKRQIVSDVIDGLLKYPEKNLGDVRRIIYEVTQMNNFNHLEQLEDGSKKVIKAKASVNDLREVIKSHDARLKEEEKVRIKRQQNFKKIKESRAVLGDRQ